MDLLSSIALYFVLWWLCLFISLPIGVRAAHEEGEDVQIGNEPGAPTKPKLWLQSGICDGDRVCFADAFAVGAKRAVVARLLGVTRLNH